MLFFVDCNKSDAFRLFSLENYLFSKKRMKYKVIYIFFLCLFQMQSQNLKIYNVNTSNYPSVTAKVVVNDSMGNIIYGLTKSNFLLQENGNLVTDFTLTCPTASSPNPLSTILLLDISTSMKVNNRLSLLRASADLWLKNMDLKLDETAIVTFADYAILNSNFTNDTAKLRKSIEIIKLRDGTDFNQAFNNMFFGALKVSQNSKNRPNIILLTDGVGDLDEEDVILKAIAQNATIHCVTIEMDIPENLKKIVEATGGLYFSKLYNENQVLDAFGMIKTLITYNKPCTIAWESGGCLNDKDAKLIYLPLDISNNIQFNGIDTLKPKLEIDKPYKYFSDFSRSEILTITARNSDIQINGISMNRQNFNFAYLDSIPKPNFILKKDQSFKINIFTNKVGDEFVLCTYTIDASTCSGNQILASYGKSGVTPGSNNIRIIIPNGGEEFPAGSTQPIKWTGTIPNQAIKVETSTNEGKQWTQVNNPIIKNTILWETPNINSTKCLARVTQSDSSYGKNYMNISTDSITIYSVDWSNDGNKIAAARQDSAISIYNAISGKLITTRKYHNGVVKAIRWSPDGIRLISGGSDSVAYIYDSFSSQITDTIKGFNGEINTIDWNSIGNSIVFGCSDSTISTLTFESGGGKTFKRSKVANGKINAVRFSPNSEFIAVAANDSLVKIIDAKRLLIIDTCFDVNTISSRTSHNGFVSGVAFNKKGDKIVSVGSGQDKLAKVWSVIPGKPTLLFTYRNHLSSLLSVDWSWYSDLIATCGIDSKVNVWVYANGQSIEKYNFNSNWNQFSVKFSPDGSRVVVGTDGINQKEKINLYSIDIFPFQQATSDSTFSLVKYNFAGQNVNFGDVKVGKITQKEYPLNDYFTMTSNGTVKIDSLIVPSNLFTASLSGNLVTKTSQATIGFYFTPPTVGAFSSDLFIYTSIGKFTYKIIGNGIQNDIEINDYNFGKIENLSTKESKVIELLNKTNRTINIKNITLTQNQEVFKFLENYTNFSLSPYQKDTIRINFEPKVSEVFGSQLDIETSSDTINSFVLGESAEPNLIYPDSVDLGTLVCDLRILTKIKLINTGKFPFKTTDVKFAKDNFRCYQPIFTIAPKDSFEIELLFDNPVSNNFSDTLYIYSSNLKYKNVIAIPLKYMYFDKTFTFNKNKIEYKNVEPNTVSYSTLEITNTSKVPFAWALPLPLIINQYFSIESYSPNPTVSGATSTITFKFNGGEKGLVSNFEFPFTICDNSNTLTLFAYVKSDNPLILTSSLKHNDLLCSDSSQTYSVNVNNAGGDVLKISSIEFAGANKDNFILIDKLPFELNFGENKEINYSINTNKSGVYKADLKIKCNDANYAKTDSSVIIPMQFNKYESSFNLSINSLEFKFIGLNNPGSQSIEVINTGTQSLYLNQSNLSDYDITINPNPVPVGASGTVTILYKGNVPTNIQLSDLVLFDSCNNTNLLSLKVLPADLASFDLQVASDTIDVGDIFEIPIRLSNGYKLEQSNLEAITVKFSVNRTILQNQGLIDNSTTLSNNERMFSVRFPIVNYNETELGKLKFKCLWGNDSISRIEIKEIKYEGKNVSAINTNKLNGFALVNDLCYAGGKRLFVDKFSSTNSISFSFDESGQLIVNTKTPLTLHSLTLNSANGSQLLNESILMLISGNNKIKTPKLTSGVYLIHYEFNGVKNSQKIVVTY